MPPRRPVDAMLPWDLREWCCASIRWFLCPWCNHCFRWSHWNLCDQWNPCDGRVTRISLSIWNMFFSWIWRGDCAVVQGAFPMEPVELMEPMHPMTHVRPMYLMHLLFPVESLHPVFPWPQLDLVYPLYPLDGSCGCRSCCEKQSRIEGEYLWNGFGMVFPWAAIASDGTYVAHGFSASHISAATPTDLPSSCVCAPWSLE